MCWDCGTLYYTHDCGCLPDQPPLAECQRSAPAAAGELCGPSWWCNRACGAGLYCQSDPEYGAGDSDAGVTQASTCRPVSTAPAGRSDATGPRQTFLLVVGRRE